MLLTVAVAAVVVYVRPVALFFVSSPGGFGLYIFILILPFIVLCPLYYYYMQHPVNLLLLGLFTVAISFAVGLTCAFTKGEVILESAILTSVGGEPDGVHVLGGQARPRLQLPGPVPLRRRHDPPRLRAHPDLLPARPRRDHGLRRPRRARLLRIHRLRHG
ncbi:hypothetical protein PR202_ga13441 [Eleusine coracana subsp. coracana]|uniref:Uncharacterized protein n=1 Tax=Eleusine coracana subsp. coracana TaxID=191504 RepID=A0AAV5CES9_ELECO|nr:hypothetical protein PR202_ga13441 [Eleusine coracana subsp. coracana]